MKEPIGDLILIVILLIPVSIILCTAIKALARQAKYRRANAPVLSGSVERRCAARDACTFGKDCKIVALTPSSPIICENMNLIVVQRAQPEHKDAEAV